MKGWRAGNRADVIEIKNVASSLESKVRFLSSTAAYPGGKRAVEARQTHMSWIFLTQDTVYKLKKPVRLSYLDFSTLERREAALRAELAINQQLAPGIYRDVVSLTESAEGLAIGGDGPVVDWLLVMRRLDEQQMLDTAISEGRVRDADLDRLIATLVRFYRHARPVFISAGAMMSGWRTMLAFDHRLLRDPRFALPPGQVARLFHVQRRFLRERRALFERRVRGRHIIDGHGDLRPEHIWLGRPIRIIDRLEFDPRLRWVDPFDEVAYLSLECERLGAAWAGARITRGLLRALPNGPSEQLCAFYRCRRATLRARLAIAHLLEPNVRMPERWRPRARDYLNLALADARRLEQFLRTPRTRRSGKETGDGGDCTGRVRMRPL